MDILTIYIWGAVITGLIALYQLKKEKEENPASLINSDDPDVKLALFVALMIVTAFWFIVIPWVIAEKFSSRNKNDNF